MGLAAMPLRFKSKRVTVPVTVTPLFVDTASGESEPVVTTADRESPESVDEGMAKATAIDAEPPALSVPAVQRIFDDTGEQVPEDAPATKEAPEGMVVST